MYFEKENIYHIYNRGNNRQKIFFSHDNYIYFLKKIRKELLPFVDILAYCLMPNHFHLLVQVKSLSTHSSDDLESSDELLSRKISNAIGVLLRSYTRAINKKENLTGSLFQQKTKAKCLNDYRSKTNYSSICFHYIHQNPLIAGLIEKMEDWEYSSFIDYCNLRKGTLCNKNLAEEIINFDKDYFYNQSYIAIDEKKLKNIF